jgi:hypothetical protein
MKLDFYYFCNWKFCESLAVAVLICGPISGGAFNTAVAIALYN